jgi:hypothetical protein
VTFLCWVDYAPEELDDDTGVPVPPYGNPGAPKGCRVGDQLATNRMCRVCDVRWRGEQDSVWWVCLTLTLPLGTYRRGCAS